MFKNKLLDFIEELLVLFEDKNKIVYKRLIYYHHQVNNKINEDELYNISIDFLSDQNVHGMIVTRNHRFMKGTPLEIDIDLLWESCTTKNKIIIWKWVEMIMETLGCMSDVKG
jgi:hypothetical protein